jgi:hypothetical protein
MSDLRDPVALIHHALQVGDWKLVELVARVLQGDHSEGRDAGKHAYRTLVARLGLAAVSDYDRR